MKIAIIIDGFFPGEKYGGPPVSINNFCNLMLENECYIITRNHDLGSVEPYKNVSSGWNSEKNRKVIYLSDEQFHSSSITKFLSEIRPDLVYLQSIFDKCILPSVISAKKLNVPILLAPRGELCRGAFKKKYKKLPYIWLMKLLGIKKNTYYQATSNEEFMAIKKWLTNHDERIFYLSNIPSISETTVIHKQKEKNRINIVYISRIVPKKNLLLGIMCLRELQGEVAFDIYGPIEDKKYWEKCNEEIGTLPKNVIVRYKGVVNHNEINECFGKYDAFLFPTNSENYGHAIVEAMIAGCIPVISDQTPWNDLNSYSAGWSLPLADINGFSNALQEIIDSDQSALNIKREALKKYVEQKLKLQELHDNYCLVMDKIVNK